MFVATNINLYSNQINNNNGGCWKRGLTVDSPPITSGDTKHTNFTTVFWLDMFVVALIVCCFEFDFESF